MNSTSPGHQAHHHFDDAERATVYRNILARRDVRGQFLPDPVGDDVLARILTAAHFAPSVGFMQPWSFVVIRDKAVKQQVHGAFTEANAEAAQMFEGKQREVYSGLRLQGILEAPVNLCITCDRDRAGPVVIGRTHIKAMDLYSTVCAVQNLWLAARAEGLGVGWVSIYRQARIREILGLPQRIIPVAYLCVGHVSHFLDQPELQTAGWRPRLPLEDLVHFDGWGGAAPEGETLREALKRAQHRAAQGIPPI
ncbi:MAG TPA: 5,6-dimethylbenzimidazole synthase [Aromatoleum sp.]|uniref:5,6-dimethylbenzimidazole synthase n=1 Tax=Aromatoleum sp. TaxID=2307007 RepID=UPI002B4748BA|nr:5,6-dimethylbenzimidazole synthase [Aromatoleum sp.]HJV27148.1 5,6-dimethylbenzimidazole synthase [Aromatoleum sp.]